MGRGEDFILIFIYEFILVEEFLWGYKFSFIFGIEESGEGAKNNQTAIIDVTQHEAEARKGILDFFFSSTLS